MLLLAVMHLAGGELGIHLLADALEFLVAVEQHAAPSCPTSEPASRSNNSSKRRLQRTNSRLRTTAMPIEAVSRIAVSSRVLRSSASSMRWSSVMSSMIHSVPSRGRSGSTALAETRHQNSCRRGA
jgi:hypothetical protein